MSDNWVVQNLENALETWNGKLAEIWTLVTQSPQAFKGGTIWNVMVGIHGAVKAIGLALIVLFFVMGVMKTCGSFADLKRPEVAVKVFVRFALAKAAVTHGLELMNALFSIAQGLVSTIMSAAGFGSAQTMILPTEIVTAVEDCGFFESIPLWAVTLIGGLLITVLSFVMIMTVYGRFFKLYLYTAIAPVPLSAFAGEPTQNIGVSFIKSYAAVCLEGAIIVLGCIIFSLFAATPPVIDPNAAAVSMVWSYIGELVFNMLILVAVGLYFWLNPILGTETVSWICVLGAAPFAVIGFVSYHGMPAEKFVWVWFRSEILEPKQLCFKPNNLYYELMKDTITKHEKEAKAKHESNQASSADG